MTSTPFGHEVRDQCRQANAEIDVESVAQFQRNATRDALALLHVQLFADFGWTIHKSVPRRLGPAKRRKAALQIIVRGHRIALGFGAILIRGCK